MNYPINKFAAAASLAVGTTYTMCTILVIIFPLRALQLVASLMHMNSLALFEPYYQVTAANFIAGLLLLMTFSFVIVWLAGFFYGLIDKKSSF